MKAHEQRPERPPAVRGQREAADHQLLAQPALRLAPVSAATLAIGSVRALAHDALESRLARLLEELEPLATHVVAEAQGGRGGFEEPPQHVLALLEPHLAQVPAVEVEQVEGEVDDRCRGVGASLKGLEARRPARQHRGDLAVEKCGARGQSADGARHLRKLLGPVLPVARDELHLSLVDPGHDPIAVVLDLVKPVVAGRRDLDDHRQGERLGAGQPSAAGAGEIREPQPRAAFSCGGSAGGHLASGADRLRMPETVALGGHLGEAAPAQDALRPRAHDVELGGALCVLVLVLDEQPRLGIVALDLDERPLTLELFALQLELQLALLERDARVHDRRPRPAVPEHDGARSVLALRDDTFEGAVLDGVVLDVHGEPLVAGVEGRALGHGPAEQHAVELEPEIVVEPGRGVLLDAVGGPAGRPLLARRLGRLREVALLPVVLEGHPGIAYASQAAGLRAHACQCENPGRHEPSTGSCDQRDALALRGVGGRCGGCSGPSAAQPRSALDDEASGEPRGVARRPPRRVPDHRAELRRKEGGRRPLDRARGRQREAAAADGRQGRRERSALFARRPPARVRGQARGRRGQPDLRARPGGRRRGAARHRVGAGRARSRVEPRRRLDRVSVRGLPGSERPRGEPQGGRRAQGREIEGARVRDLPDPPLGPLARRHQHPPVRGASRRRERFRHPRPAGGDGARRAAGLRSRHGRGVERRPRARVHARRQRPGLRRDDPVAPPRHTRRSTRSCSWSPSPAASRRRSPAARRATARRASLQTDALSATRSARTGSGSTRSIAWPAPPGRRHPTRRRAC